MANRCHHDITTVGSVQDFLRVLSACENHSVWPKNWHKCEQLRGGIIRVQYETRYSPCCDLAYDVSAAVPGSIVVLKYSEPMMVMFGDLILRNGHVLKLCERLDDRTWEWSAESGVLHAYELTYTHEDKPYCGHTTRLLAEAPCAEKNLYRPAGVGELGDYCPSDSPASEVSPNE